jgi:DNA-directed RNA polymerase III subunit RPC3
MLEPQALRCFDPLDSREDLQSSDEPLFDEATHPTSRMILERIPKDLNLATGSPLATSTNGANGHSSKNPRLVGSDSDSDSDSEPNGTANAKDAIAQAILLDKHLRLLQEDPRKFVFSEGIKWGVHFKQITRHLVQYEIENTVTAQHGLLAGRILRILQTNYSTDEKGLSTHAILKPKDVRNLTNALLAGGIIETQEIPRDTNRTTNRLLWLYSYSPEKARKQMLLDCYRTMTRLMRRIDVERAKYAIIIDKSERTDVVGHEDEFLTKKDKRLLEEWDKKEQLLWGQIFRIDDLVACMRDFAPMHDPFIGNRPRPHNDKDDKNEHDAQDDV